MQKDEHHLLPLFVKYYGEAFGYNHIHLLDNGSSPTMDSALNHAKSLGVSVNTEYSTPQDFERKGAIIGKEINAHQDDYDIFLPLDCDEFIGLKEADGSYTCDTENLLNFFSSLEPGAYRTTQRLRNNLTDLERFYVYGGGAKVFFVKTIAVGLDVGFHGCKRPKKITDTPLCHFELHNKPFEILQEHARNKMELRLNLDDVEAVKRYTDKGIHLIRYFLPNAQAAYISSMQKEKWFHTDALKQAFSKLELRHPFVGSKLVL
ncbi:MAG: glycosyltransferase family 2 protein [Paracoccaceae bacterium]